MFVVDAIRQEIRRSTYEMIMRFVLVHAVQTRRRFGPGTASFHVSVYFVLLYMVVGECYLYWFILVCEFYFIISCECAVVFDILLLLVILANF